MPVRPLQLILLLFSPTAYLLSHHFAPHYHPTAFRFFPPLLHLPTHVFPPSISLQPRHPSRHFAFSFCQSRPPFSPGDPSTFLSLLFPLSPLIFFSPPLLIFLFSQPKPFSVYSSHLPHSSCFLPSLPFLLWVHERGESNPSHGSSSGSVCVLRGVILSDRDRVERWRWGKVTYASKARVTVPSHPTLGISC